MIPVLLILGLINATLPTLPIHPSHVVNTVSNTVNVIAGQTTELLPNLTINPADLVYNLQLRTQLYKCLALYQPPQSALNPINVTIGDHGVVYITASSEAQMAYALGCVHAAMRFFEMDVFRRLAEGRLSELAGNFTVSTDVFMRTLGLYIYAQESWSYYQRYFPQVAQLLREYTRGVNTYLEVSPPPLEYAILGQRPQPWDPVDSLAFGKLMALSLAGGTSDILIARLASTYGMRIVEDLGIISRPLDTPILTKPAKPLQLNKVPKSPPPCLIAGSVPVQCIPLIDPPMGNFNESSATFEGPSADFVNWFMENMGIIRGVIGSWLGGVGSNNWVVSGRLTSSGKPLLANDPHLQLTAPPIWFIASLKVPGDLDVYGVTFPGIPLVIIGRNQYIAWGFTTTGVDVIDFYYYKWNGTKYLYGGKWLEASERNETINVCYPGGACTQRTITVLETVHGPVLDFGGTRYAARWLGSGVSTEGIALYMIDKARGLSDFMDALRYWIVPSQNAVYADVNGNIAYFVTGYFPIRINHRGDVVPSYLPFNGSAGDGGWATLIWLPGYLNLVNPKDGYVATANNKVIQNFAKDFPIYLGLEYAAPYRYDRIVEMIRVGVGKISPGYFMGMQYDVHDISCRQFIPLINRAYQLGNKPQDLAPIISKLNNWDCNMSQSSNIAAVYGLFYYNLLNNIWQSVLNKAGIAGLISPTGIPGDIAVYVLQRALNGDPIALSIVPDPVNTILDSLRESLTQNNWGYYHKYNIQHPLGSAIPPLGLLLNYPIVEAPGDWNTVNAASSFSVRSGPSMRFIADMSGGKAYVVVAGGQDGNPYSPYYRDMYYMWLRGEYVTLGDTSSGVDQKGMEETVDSMVGVVGQVAEYTDDLIHTVNSILRTLILR